MWKKPSKTTNLFEIKKDKKSGVQSMLQPPTKK